MKANVLVLQSAVCESVPHLNLTEGRHRRLLAGLADYEADYVHHNRHRHPYWQKIEAIKRQLDAGYETVLWMDADTILVEPMDFSSVLGDADVGMVRNGNDYNAGVILFKVNEKTRRFFQQVDRDGPWSVFNPGDQPVLMRYLSWLKAKELGPEFNFYARSKFVPKRVVIKGFHDERDRGGLKRLREMELFLGGLGE